MTKDDDLTDEDPDVPSGTQLVPVEWVQSGESSPMSSAFPIAWYLSRDFASRPAEIAPRVGYVRLERAVVLNEALLIILPSGKGRQKRAETDTMPLTN